MTLPIPDPEAIALHNIQKLIAKACGNPAFLTDLLADPVAKAKLENFDMRPQDLKHYQQVVDDLKRFAPIADVDPEDALSWAGGVILRRVLCPNLLLDPPAATPRANWNPVLTSIQRAAFICIVD